MSARGLRGLGVLEALPTPKSMYLIHFSYFAGFACSEQCYLLNFSWLAGLVRLTTFENNAV